MKPITRIRDNSRPLATRHARLVNLVAARCWQTACRALIAMGMGGVIATAQDGPPRVDAAAGVPVTYSDAVMALKPVGYWPLNETAPVSVDVAGNSSTLGAAVNGAYLNYAPTRTPVAGALAGSGDNGQAFNGTSQSMLVPYTAALNPAAPFSAEIWLKPALQLASGAMLCAVSSGQFASPRSGWLIYQAGSTALTDNTWNLRTYTGVGTATAVSITSAAGSASMGVWHHLVVVCDGTTCNLYVDGVVAASAATGTTVPGASGGTRVGGRADGAYFWSGAADEFAIYNTSLSAAEVLQHYQNGTNASRTMPYETLVLSKDPVAYYRLGEVAYTQPAMPTAVNLGSLGAAANGTYAAGTFPGAAGPTPMPGLGTTNSACRFDGTGQISCGSDNGLNIDQISIAAWIKTDGVLQYMNILAKGGLLWRLNMNANSSQLIWTCPGGGATGTKNVADGAWHHVVAVAGSAGSALYVDGQLNATGPAISTIADNADPVLIGSQGNASLYRWKGSLDEVALFNTALTAPQVADLYLAAEPPAADILTFGPGALINGTSIAWTAPHRSNLKALAPVFTLAPGSSCDHISGTPYDFSSPVSFKVTASDLTTQTYTVTATVDPQPATLASTFNLGVSGNGTFFEGGAYHPWIAQGTLPAGSFLRSVAIDATLESTDNSNWAAELMVLCDPTPGTPGGDGLLEIGPDYINLGSAQREFWTNGFTGPVSTVTGTKTAGVDFPTDIDLGSVGLFLINGYGGPVTGGTWSGTVTVTYEVASPSLILTFGLPGNPGVIDQAAKSITLNVPAGTDVTTLAPTYTVSPFATGNPASGTARDFTTPQTYTITAQDGSTTVYTVTVIVAGGLQVKTYDTTYGSYYLNPIANLMALSPSATSTQVANIAYGDFVAAFPGLTDGESFSLLWEGWFDVSKDGPGLYTFGTNSDDGSAIYLDLNGDGDFADPGEMVVDNNWNHGPYAMTGTVMLGMDAVRIAIGFYEEGGGEMMVAGFKKGDRTAYAALDPINGTSGHFFTVKPAGSPSAANVWNFGLPGYPAVVAGTNITWPLPPGTNVSALAPTFAISTGANAVPPSGTVRNFTTPQTYTVTARDGSIKTYTATAAVSASDGLLVKTFDTTYGTFYLDPISNLMAVTPSGTSKQFGNLEVTRGNFAPVLPGLTGNDTFSILWEGWFDVSKDGPGTYTFGVDSDDGSVIYLDLNGDGDFADTGEQIVDNNRDGASLVRTGEVTLGMDAVHVAIGYYENAANQNMTGRFKKGSGLAFSGLDAINGYSGHFFSSVPPANPVAANLWDCSLPGNPAVMTGTNIILTVPYGTDVAALAPTFTISSGASAVPPSGSVRNFTTPQTYTVTSANLLTTKFYTVTLIVAPTWIRDASGLWSTPANWGGGNVANGIGVTADFNSIDITADRTVSLDSPRAIGNLIFGDTTPASAAGWILSNNSSAVNILTLAGAAPTIAVNSLGAGKSATISAQLAGTAGLIKTGAGTLTLTNTNTYTGDTVIEAGVLRVGGTNGNLGPGNVTNHGILAFNTSGALTMPYEISGAGSLRQEGPGTVALTAANTFAGPTLVNGGTLYASTSNRANYASLSFTSGITINNGGTLRSSTNGLFGWDHSQTHPITINAGGTLTTDAGVDVKIGNVILAGGTLASGGSHTGWGSWVFAGTANPGGAATLATTASSVVSATAVAFHAGAIIDVSAGKTLNFTGTIVDVNDGISQVTKAGLGTLTLTGTNTYTGNTTVAGGSLVLADNAALRFVVTNSSNNRLTGTGTATLNGDFIIDTSAVTATYGAWALVDVTTLTETFGATFTPAGTGWSESANVWTKLDGTKVWTFSEATGILALYLQGNQAAVWTGGGTGTWNTSATNWSGVTGTPWSTANGPGNTAQFAKAGDAATLSGTVVAGTLQFNQSAALSGPGALGFGTTTSTLLVAVANGRTATIGADFVGAAVAASQGNKLAKTGSGTLVLAGATNLVTGDADVTLAAGYTVEGGGILQVTGALKAASRSQTTALGQPNFRNQVGSTSAGNALIVNGSGSVISGGIDIGYSTFGNNSVTISSPGTQALPSYVIIGRNQTLAIGGASSNNNLTINNGAYLLYSNGGGTQTLTLGTNAGANNNAILVDGAGSTLDRVNAGGFAQPGGFPGATGGAITVGVLGSNNRLTVSNGGNILPRRISVGEGGSNNTWVMTRSATGASADGTNAVFQVGSASGATDNSFVISEGGKYFFNGTATTRICAVGTVAGAHNNILRIAGANSQFNINHAAPLAIGGTAINNVITNGGNGNRLDILDGGTLVSTAPVILAGGSAANRTVFNLGNGIGSTAEAIVGASLAQSNSHYVNQSIIGNTPQLTNRWDAGGQTFSPGVNLTTTNTVLCINNGRLAAGQGASMLAAPLVSGVGTVDLGGPAYLSIPAGQTAGITPAITGVGSLIKEGAGALAILGVNTYTGNTTVAGGTLVLADNAALRFVLTDDANNMLAGSGDAILNGDFIIDTTAVTATTGAWTLVDVASLKATFGATFAITGPGWSESANVWTLDDGTRRWTFTESTGVLYLVIGGPPPDLSDGCTWEEWQWYHPLAGKSRPGDNPDGDNHDNLVECAFGLPPDSGQGTPFRLRPSTTATSKMEITFIRPLGITASVTYFLEYSRALGDAATWISIPLQNILPRNIVISPTELPYTESVTIRNFEAREGFVRIRAELDSNDDHITDHISRTDIEGWTESALDQGSRTYNNPYQQGAVFTGTVDASGGVAGQTLHFVTSAGGTNLATLLAPGVAYYLEVTAGDNEGQRFDVISAAGSAVTLAIDSDLCAATPPFNTLTDALPASLTGDRVAIHPHWTLGGLFPVTRFFAAGNLTAADQVHTFANNIWTTYWLYTNSGSPKWVMDGDPTLADCAAAVIAPGQGMFIGKQSTAAPVMAFGEVREHKFVRPLCAGSNLMGGGYPLAQSATGAGSRQMDPAHGFFGSPDPVTGDTFSIFKGDATKGATGYDDYHLFTPGTGSKWVKAGDASLTSRDAEKLFLADRSAFIRLQSNSPAYAMPCPWAPTPFTALQHAVGSTSWQQWQAAELAGEPLNGPDDDPDCDATPNLLEFVFGTPPLLANPPTATPVEIVTVAGQRFLQITIPRRSDRLAAMCVQVSPDLTTWESGTGFTGVVSDDPAALVVRDLTPLGAGAPRRFMRLQVALPD